VDWNNPATHQALSEPRRGERAVLRAVLAAPWGPLVVYSAHFEVFCGLLARVQQLGDVFRDARVMRDRVRSIFSCIFV
jgi:endonuclease/exonuclease/phosphatase family metal-dependent hydrolase